MGWDKMPKRYRPTKKAPETPAEARHLLKSSVSEGAIQQDGVNEGRRRGWHVHVSYTGSQGGGVVYATPGIPDTYWARAGIQFWIEYKAPGKSLRPGQIKTIASMRAAGVVVYVVDQLGETDKILDRYDTRLRQEGKIK